MTTINPYVPSRMAAAIPNQREAPASTGIRLFDVFLILVLLTAAMFDITALTVLKAGRTVALAIQYVAWAIAAGTLMMRMARPWHRRLISSLQRSIAVYFAGLFASFVLVWLADIRLDIGDVLQQTLALAYISLPFFALQTTAKTIPVERAMILSCHVLFALSALSIGGEVLGIFHFEISGNRYFGFVGDAVAWTLILPLIVYFASGRLFLAGIAAVCLALTGSRAPALCVVGSLLLLMTFARGHRLKYVTMLVVLGLVLAFESDLFDVVIDRLAATQFGSNDRVTTATVGLELFRKSPFFGNGYNALAYYFPRDPRADVWGFRGWTQTSPIVQTLSDGGLVWFLPYLGFMIAATAGSIAVIRKSRFLPDGGGIMSGLAAWLTGMLWLDQSTTWLVVGTVLGPLVFGVAGVISAYWARLNAATTAAQSMSRSIASS